MKNKEDLKPSADLWESFKNTQYFDELERFCLEKTRELRDSIIQASVDRDYEKSRDLGQQLCGFRLMTDFIDDTISTRAEEIQSEREAKDFNKQLPHRL
jgi:hypothetical protein